MRAISARRHSLLVRVYISFYTEYFVRQRVKVNGYMLAWCCVDVVFCLIYLWIFEDVSVEKNKGGSERFNENGFPGRFLF